MENRIAYIENKDLGRYLQSLDSVRFNESDQLACKTQAKLEVLASLMLGRTIPIGEHQFIDSYGFISNACEILTAFQSLPELDRKRINHVFPFQLFFRAKYKTLDGLIAEKLRDPDYKLSLWSTLGQHDNAEMTRRRKEIGEKIEKGNFKYEDDDLVPNGDRETAQMLHMMRNQFAYGEREQVFTLYGAKTVGLTSDNGMLEAGIKKICDWSEKELNYQLNRQEEIEKSGFVTSRLLESDLIPQAIELIDMLNKLRNAGLKIYNRSHIRIGYVIDKDGKETTIKFKDFVNNESKFDGILEIFDSLYNSSLAKASFAHSESISTARNIYGNTYIRAASALTTIAKNEITDQADLVGDFFNPPWIQNFSFSLGEPTVAKSMLNSMPWEYVWEAYLDTKWRKSVSELNQVLLKWDNLINNPTTLEKAYFDITHELDDAYDKHIDNVSNILAPSGWGFLRDQKTSKVVIQLLPWAGGLAAKGVASLIIQQVNFDPFWEETLPDGLGGIVVYGINKVIDPVGLWVTKGYIRKTFARLIGLEH